MIGGDMTGEMRLGRGLVVALLIVVVSAAFHTAGGGCLDHFTSAGFLLLAAGTLVAAITLSSREWTMPRLLALVAVVQIGFHGLFETLDYAGAQTSLIAGHAHAFDAQTPVMLLAHVSAALCIALVLRRGERWLLTFASVVASLLARPVEHPSSPIRPPHATLPQAPKESGLRRILFSRLLTHRGPPSMTVALATS